MPLLLAGAIVVDGRGKSSVQMCQSREDVCEVVIVPLLSATSGGEKWPLCGFTDTRGELTAPTDINEMRQGSDKAKASEKDLNASCLARYENARPLEVVYGVGSTATVCCRTRSIRLDERRQPCCAPSNEPVAKLSCP